MKKRNESRFASNKLIIKKSRGIKYITFRGQGGCFNVLINEKDILNRKYPNYSLVTIVVDFDNMLCFIDGSPFGKIKIDNQFTIDLETTTGQYAYFVDIESNLQYKKNNLLGTNLKNITSVVDLYESIYKFESNEITQYSEIIQGVWLVARHRLNLYLQYIFELRDNVMKIDLSNQFLFDPNPVESKELLNLDELKESKNIIMYHSSYTNTVSGYKNTRLNFLESGIEDYIIFADELIPYGLVCGDISTEKVKNLTRKRNLEIVVDSSYNKIFKQIEKKISMYYGCIIPINFMLFDAYRHFVASASVWEDIFCKVKPKQIFYLAGYNNVPLVYQANKQNIITKEYQYSATTYLHLAYNMSEGISDVYKPHTFFAWGDYFLTQYNVDAKNKVVLGYDMDVNSLEFHKKTKNILIISQPSIRDDVVKLVPKLSKCFKDWNVIIKPHRVELYNICDEYLELEKFENVTLIKNAETPFGQLLHNSEIAISSFSTGLYEALSVGVKVFLIGKDKANFIDNTLMNDYDIYLYKNIYSLKKTLAKKPKEFKPLLNPIDFNLV